MSTNLEKYPKLNPEEKREFTRIYIRSAIWGLLICLFFGIIDKIFRHFFPDTSIVPIFFGFVSVLIAVTYMNISYLVAMRVRDEMSRQNKGN